MDVRSVVTKNKIKMALLDCMRDKPVANILNKDIIDRSDVSARSFYHYYKSKDEILNEIEDELIEGLKQANDADFEYVKQVDHPLSDEENIALAEKEFKHLVDYCDSIKDMAEVLTSPNGDMRFILRLRDISAAETQRRLDYLLGENYLPNDSGKSDIPKSLVINIIVGAVIGTILTWLESDNKISPHQLRKLLGMIQVMSPAELLTISNK